MTYERKLAEFTKGVHEAIQEAVSRQAKQSKFFNTRTIHVPLGNLSFNLGGERYLTEIGETQLWDDRAGYYNYNVLSLEQLCALADEFAG